MRGQGNLGAIPEDESELGSGVRHLHHGAIKAAPVFHDLIELGWPDGTVEIAFPFGPCLLENSCGPLILAAVREKGRELANCLIREIPAVVPALHDALKHRDEVKFVRKGEAFHAGGEPGNGFIFLQGVQGEDPILPGIVIVLRGAPV